MKVLRCAAKKCPMVVNPVQGGVGKDQIESSVDIQGSGIHPRELQRREQCLWIVQGSIGDKLGAAVHA